MRNIVTPHMISFVNRRHISVQKLDASIQDILNQYNLLAFQNYGGVEKQPPLMEQNTIYMKKTYCQNTTLDMGAMEE